MIPTTGVVYIFMYYFHTLDQRKASAYFADIYTQSLRAAGPRAVGVYVSKIPSSCGVSDIYIYIYIYHLGRTHLIGERTNENSSRLFYTVASED